VKFRKSLLDTPASAFASESKMPSELEGGSPTQQEGAPYLYAHRVLLNHMPYFRTLLSPKAITENGSIMNVDRVTN
jgi:hypothetical protein